MRILVLSNLFPPDVVGGAEILCAQVCEQLRRRGYDVRVLTSGDEPPARSHAFPVTRALRLTRPFGVPASRIGWRDTWRAHRHNHEATRAALARDRPDIVFAWSQRRLTLGGVRATMDAGVPLAFSFNDNAIAAYATETPRPTPRSLARGVLRSTVFRQDTLRDVPLTSATAISRHLKRDLIAAGVAAQDVEVIYQAIDVARFPCKPEPGAIGAPPRMLYVGSFLPEKGVHTIVEAAHLLARSRPGTSVTLVGDGPADYGERLRHLASRGPATVFFTGRMPHDQVAGIYRNHDILVFASAPLEAFGLTPLEAMASGTTVVSTAVGGHSELVVDGRNALVFREGDAVDLVRCLHRLVSMPDLSRLLARNARAQVTRQFSLDRYADDLERFLLSALRGNHALRRSA
jgi:glycogen(starch) synthase